MDLFIQFCQIGAMNSIISLCKRRGFLFQSSEIYGGLQGFYDYGPLGVELKNNLKRSWWRSIVYERADVEGIDSSIVTHPLVLRYSGHERRFTDPMVDCRECHHRMRADHLVDAACTYCGSVDLTDPKPFNLMLRTRLGPVDDGTGLAYLRPETAQGIFINFRNIVDTTSRRLPFGIAQIGKAFRNEVTPKNLIFRMREFEQMELEFFVPPGMDEEWYESWVTTRYNWWLNQGIAPENLKLEAQNREELAHYAKATTDILYRFPFGFEEIEGISNRTDYDLGSHSKNNCNLNIFAQTEKNSDATSVLTIDEQEQSVVPFVIEPSAGVDRAFLAILSESYTEEKWKDGRSRRVMKIKPHLAPVKAAVIPLVSNNSEIVNKSREIALSLRRLGLGLVRCEEIGNIGKAYRRHDEIGTPLCITVDFNTLEEETVTVRYRDSMEQIRIKVGEIESFFSNYYQSL